MSINYKQLDRINKTLENFPSAKLQIVTKNRDIKTIKELIEKGYSLFGENKVQEANEKFKDFNAHNLDLHLIGPLQTNKVKLALKVFNTIQSIDREKLVNEIVKVKNKSEIKTVDFFIQVNIGEEEQKSGVLPNNLERLYNHCINQNLNISGLMCIPPLGDNAKSYFDKIRSLRDKLNLNLKLSMGMSSDYEISLNCGSNLIRVGSLIFN
jgi:pyridoxal phosphate enzyme (YggS family)